MMRVLSVGDTEELGCSQIPFLEEFYSHFSRWTAFGQTSATVASAQAFRQPPAGAVRRIHFFSNITPLYLRIK
jgi:hypothetical protein